LAETGSAPWKGLALGGAVTAVVVALGLWLGGVFDPMRGIEEGAATTGTGGESPATAATTGPVTGQDSTGATTAADQAQQAEAPAQQAQAAQTDQAQADQSRTDQAQADQAQADQAQADQAQSGEAAADAPAAQTSADQAGTATSAAPAPSDTATSDTAASDTTAPARTETASDAATGTRTADAPAAGAEATADSRTQTATDTAAATDTTTPATAAPASGETQQAQATAPQTAPTTGDTSGTSDGTSGSVASAAAPSASGTTGTTTPGTQSMTTRTAATDTAQATATASPQSDTPPAGDTAAAPRFDVVRMETDGAALVAGAAEPGEKVQVLVDGQVVGEETAGGDGKFVAFLDLPSSDASRVVTLRTAREGGEVASTQEVILGPTAKPAPDGDASATTAAAAPTVLLSDRDGVKVLQAPGAGSSDEVSIGAVSYADNGAVTMTGRGLAGALLRVYLDGAPVTESRIAEDGSWTLDLSGIAGGDRLLRIDEIAADGTVRSRVETPFNRDAGATIRTAAADAATTAAAETATPAVAEPAATAQADAATGAPATAAPQPDTETATAAQGGAQDSATTIAATTTAPTAAPVPSITQVTVERGSTLWAIAREKYGEGLMYVRVFEANKDLIRNPDLIYPGQVFHLPD
jgi:nucleoid-associated protein YgaU